MNFRQSWLRMFRIVGISSLLLGAFLSSAHAQVYEKVFSFTDARAADIAAAQNRGSLPQAGLLQGTDGFLYGTSSAGGGTDNGTIFKISPNGQLTTLVQFGYQNVKGRLPQADLIQGADGNFYGTTAAGGANDDGTIFKVTPSGLITTLVEFAGSAAPLGSQPSAALLQGNDGNFYGSTATGGAQNFGTLFKMTPAGVLSTLVNFTQNASSNKGAGPNGLILATDGNFYGTTATGGTSNKGTVYRVGSTFGSAITTLAVFTGNGTPKGATPSGPLVQASDGNFYGTTAAGGANNLGTIFRITTNGALTTLVEFTGAGATNRGSAPRSALIQGLDGNLYGTTSQGGASNLGTLFKVTLGGVLTTLLEFTSNGGQTPLSDLTLGSDGLLYGTTSLGGASNKGTLFKITAGGALTDLVDFTGTGTSHTGRTLVASLTVDAAGNLLGTTSAGGINDKGTVFKLTPAGTLTTLVEFTDNGAINRGASPKAGLTLNSDGNFYGTTAAGGANSDGTIFKMTPAGALTTLIDFSGTAGPSKGDSPWDLVLGTDGNFYGTTQTGGVHDQGTAFKMTPAGALSTLFEFQQLAGETNGGALPLAGLVQATDGNFYGTTSIGSGGGNGTHGTLFRMTSSGTMTTVGEFNGGLGGNSPVNPEGRLFQASDSKLYGTTNSGGSSGAGTVYSATVVAGNQISVLANFSTFGGGANPEAGLVQTPDHTLYGTTAAGGSAGSGTIFKMDTSGTLTLIFDFASDPADSQPAAALVFGADGNLYGTTSAQGTGDGSVFRLVFAGPPAVYPLDAQPQGGGSALLQCKVNPRGSSTTATLEYGTDGVNFPNVVTLSSSFNGFKTFLFGTTLTGLQDGVIYYYRFRAVSSSGTVVSPTASFSTLVAPIAAVSLATQVTQTSAQFNGSVNANNYSSTAHFEYGTNGNTFPNQVAATPATINGNSAVPVTGSVAGLTKGTTYYYRLVATNSGGTDVSGVNSFSTLTEPTATAGGAVALSTISALVNGSANANGSNTQVVFEYGTDGINFPNSVAATPSLVTGNVDTMVSAELDNLTQGGTYYYRIKGTSAGGVGVSNSASFSLNILSGLTQLFPPAPPDAQGFVIVTLTPSGITSGWRFVGEQLWRASGSVAGGLTTGDRQIEFRPVPGYVQPLTETVTVTSGAPATQIAAEYFPTTAGQAGGLEVILKPDSIANTGLPVANRGQWRFLGEDDTQWRNSGITVSGLLPGKYLVECKPIPGKNTPSSNVVPVQSNQTTLATITYYTADATVGTQPGVLPFQTTSQNGPYSYVGQIRSDVGSGTGFVVNRRVVATAGHVVFDDGTLSYVTGLQWLFERDAGTYDPVPQIPAGFYVFDGYATQRTAENTPGQSSVASQNLDVAAMYFLADAGRGGYAGFLASDSTDNEFLVSSKLKMVVGYPVNGIPSANQGRMFATSPFNVTFTRVPGTDSNNSPYRVYTTQDITSAGGNSGGPICVLYDNGNYYPAAIYLGGSAQTSVRAIDSKAVDLFNRAEVSGDGGGNQVGGGIIQVNTPISGAIFQAAALKVNLAPDTAVNGGAMWSLSPTDVPFSNGFERDNLNPVGTYTLYFAPATGFLTPPPATITLTAGQLSTVTRTYFGVTTQPQNQVAPVGSNVTFSVATSGTPTGYQWRRNGFNISGATASSYTLNNVTSNDTATYSCVVTWTEVAPSTVTGPVSQTSGAATLTVTDTFASWSNRFFTSTELSNSQISGPTADPDGDGVPNLLEFAFNLQPRIEDRSVMIAGTGTSGLPLVRLETISNQKVLTIEFVRRRAAGSPGITYHAEFGSDLTNPNGWSETGTSVVTQIDDTWERVKITDSLTNQAKRFGRVRVTIP